MLRHTTRPLATLALAALGLSLAPTNAVAAQTTANVATTAVDARTAALPFETFTDTPLPSTAAQVTRELFLSNVSYRSYFGHDAPTGVDWDQESVFLYSAGTKPTSGYAAGVSTVQRATDGSLSFSTTLKSPGSNCSTASVVTTPYVLVTFPRSATPPPGWTSDHTDTVDTCAQPVTLSSSFAVDADGWSTGFSDYSPVSDDMRLEAGIAPLPAATATGNGLRLQGMNRSDDLFMYLKRRLDTTNGVVPHQRYSVRTSVSFWTNSSSDCFGSGGNPGSSVYLKAGGSTVEPAPVLDSTNTYWLNVDKGHQSQDGPSGTVIGDIDNGLPCEDGRWVKVTRTTSTPVQVQADADGVLWLLVGTDSGYEGLTILYYTDVTATLTAL